MERGPLRKRAGFTLAELLIATALFGTIVAAAASLLYSVLLSYETRKAAVETAFLGQRLLDEWCSQSQLSDAPAEGTASSYAYTLDRTADTDGFGVTLGLRWYSGGRLLSTQSRWTPRVKREVWASTRSGWIRTEECGPAEWEAAPTWTIEPPAKILRDGRVFVELPGTLRNLEPGRQGTQLAATLLSEGQFVVGIYDTATRRWSERLRGPASIESLAWLGDESLVAGVGGKKLVRISRHGADTIFEASPGEWVSSPHASPDRKKLAFISNRSGSNDVWILDLATSGLHQVTRDPLADLRPRWSDDGLRLLFAAYEADGKAQLFTINPDGSGRASLNLEVTGQDYDWAR